MNEKNWETRKVQTTGGSTFTISLPKKWVDGIGLKAGDEMVVEEQDSSLLLSPVKFKKEKPSKVKIRISPDEDCNTLKRKILSLYLVGHNSITVRSSEDRLKPDHRNAVKELVRKKLVGTEIISESIEEIVLQTLLSYSELSVKDSLKRMYKVASSMQNTAMIALEDNDKELAKDVVEIDDEVDRFQMYLVRSIKAAMQTPVLVEEIGLGTLRECLAYRLVSKNVERSGDHAVLIAKNVLEMKHKINHNLLEMLKGVNSKASSIFEKAIDSLFKGDYKAAEEVIHRIDKVYILERNVNRFLSEEKPAETIRIRFILESIRRIAEYGSDIAEIVLNLNVDKERWD